MEWPAEAELSSATASIRPEDGNGTERVVAADQTNAETANSRAKMPMTATKIIQAKAGKAKKLSGIFRGEWGATPIYAKDDRVNFERGVYLSLVGNNQNQPPTTSTGYWRLLGKYKAIKEANCLSPAPNLDMDECDFTTNTSLKDMDLRGAKLQKARLSGELGFADLSGADLSGAAVIGSLTIGPDTKVEGANFSRLQSEGNNPLIAEHAQLAHTDFSQANLYGAKMADADLNGAKLTEAVLTGSQLTSANFSQADLTKSDLAYANLASSTLSQTKMVSANLEQADISHADLSQAKLQQANFAGSNLSGSNFSGADLRGVNFTGAQNADTATFDRDTDFTAAICPDGVVVDGTQVTTCVGHGF